MLVKYCPNKCDHNRLRINWNNDSTGYSTGVTDVEVMMQFKTGTGWKACSDEERGFYSAEYGGGQNYDLYEITKENRHCACAVFCFLFERGGVERLQG